MYRPGGEEVGVGGEEDGQGAVEAVEEVEEAVEVEVGVLCHGG